MIRSDQFSNSFEIPSMFILSANQEDPIKIEGVMLMTMSNRGGGGGGGAGGERGTGGGVTL